MHEVQEHLEEERRGAEEHQAERYLGDHEAATNPVVGPRVSPAARLERLADVGTRQAQDSRQRDATAVTSERHTQNATTRQSTAISVARGNAVGPERRRRADAVAASTTPTALPARR